MNRFFRLLNRLRNAWLHAKWKRAHNAALKYQLSNQFEEMESQFLKAKQIAEQFVPQDKHLFFTQQDLTAVYYQWQDHCKNIDPSNDDQQILLIQNKLEEAVFQYMELNNRLFDGEQKNANLIHAYTYLANLYASQRKKEKSFEYHLKAYELGQLFDPLNGLYLMTILNMGGQYFLSKKYNKAKELALQAYQCSKEKYPDHPMRLIGPTRLLIKVYRQTGETDKLEELQQEEKELEYKINQSNESSQS
jgi:hypothetical protein